MAKLFIITHTYNWLRYSHCVLSSMQFIASMLGSTLRCAILIVISTAVTCKRSLLFTGHSLLARAKQQWIFHRFNQEGIRSPYSGYCPCCLLFLCLNNVNIRTWVTPVLGIYRLMTQFQCVITIAHRYVLSWFTVQLSLETPRSWWPLLLHAFDSAEQPTRACNSLYKLNKSLYSPLNAGVSLNLAFKSPPPRITPDLYYISDSTNWKHLRRHSIVSHPCPKHVKWIRKARHLKATEWNEVLKGWELPWYQP